MNKLRIKLSSSKLFLKVIFALLALSANTRTYMNKQDGFDGSIPEHYDQHLGPLLFEYPASDMAKRVKASVPSAQKVLEVACGTGISTKHLRMALPDKVSILATDFSADMLNLAKHNLSQLKNIEHQVVDATSLPFDDGSFSAVVCEFGIMFFADKAKGMGEMVRVAEPGGLVAMNVWSSLKDNPIVAVAKDTIDRFFAQDPPKFLNVPFGYNDVDEIKQLMHDSGLVEVEADVVSFSIDTESASNIAKGFVMGNPTIVKINEEPGINEDEVIEAVADAIQREFGSETPAVKLQEIVFTGVKK